MRRAGAGELGQQPGDLGLGGSGVMAWLLAVPPPGLAFYAVSVETLTFLLTDIEGLTALLGRLGEDVYAQMIARAG